MFFKWLRLHCYKLQVLSGNGCARDILETHLLPNVICSGVVRSKARTLNQRGKHVVFNRDEEDVLTVEDVRVAVRDVMGTNGVLHVVEEVLVPESARSVDDALKVKKPIGFIGKRYTSGKNSKSIVPS